MFHGKDDKLPFPGDILPGTALTAFSHRTMTGRIDLPNWPSGHKSAVFHGRTEKKKAS